MRPTNMAIGVSKTQHLKLLVTDSSMASQMGRTASNIEQKSLAAIMVCWTSCQKTHVPMYGTLQHRKESAEEETQHWSTCGHQIPTPGPVRDWKLTCVQVGGRGSGSVKRGSGAGMKTVRICGREQWCGRDRAQPGLAQPIPQSRQ